MPSQRPTPATTTHRLHANRLGQLVSRRNLFAGLGALGVAAAVAACGNASVVTAKSNAPAGAATTNAAVAGSPVIVATTNVYASIAQLIGGDKAAVSAILSDPAADPHEFEITPADKLAISKAGVVIVNGGGYDEWADMVLDSLSPRPVVLNAFELSGHAATASETETHADPAEGETHDDHSVPDAGHAHEHGGTNEHVFYDLHVVHTLAESIAAELTKLAPTHAAEYTANLAKFTLRIEDYEARLAGIAKAHPSFAYIATESVADYLISEAGGSNVTPEKFADAVESGGDLSVGIMNEVNQLITGKKAKVLVFNSQTNDAATAKLKDLATKSGVGILPVTETLPTGVTSYLEWINNAITGLEKALAV